MSGYVKVTPANPAYTTNVLLDGQRVQLRFRWHSRNSMWYLDIFDLAGNRLAAGRAVNYHVNLTRYLEDFGMLMRGTPDSFERLDLTQLYYLDKEVLEEFKEVLGV